MKRIAFIFIGLVLATNAWATSPKQGLGWGDKRLLEVEKKYHEGKPLSAEEAKMQMEFNYDKEIYESIGKLLWPVCSDEGGGDMAPSCDDLSSAQRAAAPYVEDKWHYHFSPATNAELKKMSDALEKKWMGK